MAGESCKVFLPAGTDPGDNPRGDFLSCQVWGSGLYVRVIEKVGCLYELFRTDALFIFPVKMYDRDNKRV
jgi:hypothetical protein